MAGGAGKRKGSAFERCIAEQLSDWWEPGRSDIFWRTATSGGRATRRSKKNKQTRFQYGDITATDPIGTSLLRVMTLELKIGYANSSIQDLLDRNDKLTAVPEFCKWIDQINYAADCAGSFGWGLIVHRQQRKDMICLSMNLYMKLRRMKVRLDKIKPQFTCLARTQTRYDKKDNVEYIGRDIALFVIPLEKFFGCVSRKNIVTIAKWWKQENRND